LIDKSKTTDFYPSLAKQIVEKKKKEAPATPPSLGCCLIVVTPSLSP